MVDCYLLEVEVYIRSTWHYPLFTGKLVKSILIDAEPRLKPVFERAAGPEPKLIHITPLYEANGGKVRCVYSKARRVGAKWRVEPVRVAGRYRFYVGMVESWGYSFDLVYNAVLNSSGRHVFSNHLFEVEVISGRTVDVESLALTTVRALVRGDQDSGESAKLRVVFASPTLLRDPFRRAKYKSLIPTPVNIFSTPLYTYLYLTGSLNQKNLYTLAILIHRLLSEAHTVHDTVRKTWVYYEPRKIIPTLTGYVNLHLNQDYYEWYSKKYDLEELLTESLKITQTLGTGTSRAAGFGHITLEAIRKD